MDSDTSHAAPEPYSNGRRTFFKRLFQLLASLWAVGFAGSIAAFLKPPKHARGLVERTIEVGPLDAFSPGQGRLVTGSHNPFWIILAPNGKLVALPAVCTHRHCILEWEADNERLLCPCHLGTFDLNGNVLSGPPPRPLTPLSVTVKGGKVYVYP